MCRTLFLSPLFLISLLALALFGCVSPYQEVRQKDTIPAYEEFLSKHPNAPERSDAEQRLENLLYQRTNEDNSEASYQAYLQRFPRGRFSRQARQQVEIFAYRRTRERDTLEQYQDFLRRFPFGTFSRDAKDRIEEMFFLRAMRFNSFKGMQAYLHHFSKGRFRRQAEEKYRAFWWDRIEKQPSIAAINAWLDVFRDGPLVSRAQRTLELLRYRALEESGKWWLLQRWIKNNPESSYRKQALDSIRIFRRIYPTIERARRHMESDERKEALSLYRSLDSRYTSKHPSVERLLKKDLALYKVSLQDLRTN